MELLEAWEDELDEAEIAGSNNSDSDSGDAIFPGLNLSTTKDSSTARVKSAPPKPIKAETAVTSEDPMSSGPQKNSTGSSQPASVQKLEPDGPPTKRKLKRKITGNAAASALKDHPSSMKSPAISVGAPAGKTSVEAPAGSSEKKADPLQGPPPLPKEKSDSPQLHTSDKSVSDESSKVVAAKAAGMPDFSVLEKLSETKSKADGAALDAFFSNQNAPASGMPAPEIDIKLSQPPKKGTPSKKKGKRSKSKGDAGRGDEAAN